MTATDNVMRKCLLDLITVFTRLRADPTYYDGRDMEMLCDKIHGALRGYETRTGPMATNVCVPVRFQEALSELSKENVLARTACRAALRRLQNPLLDTDLLFSDVKELLRIALETNETIADGEWLRSVGALPMGENGYVFGERIASVHSDIRYPLRLCWDDKGGAFISYVFGHPIHAKPTRDDVRLLCHVLGIELKG